jgi:hypothetical protein
MVGNWKYVLFIAATLVLTAAAVFTLLFGM